MAKFILNDDGSFTQEKKRKKQTSKYEELKNVPFTGQSKFKNQTSGTYFKKSEGNAGQAIGYSALDALGNFTEGSLNFFEGMSDSARYAGANVLDFFGADKKAKEIRERARENDVEDIVNQWNHITAGDLSGTKSEKEIGRFKKVEDNSIFGEKSDQVIQGVGNSLTGAAVGSYLGAPITGVGKGADLARNVIGLTSFGSSAAGHATTEAYNEGANDFQAGVYGILSGAVESGSEMLFGGLGKINKSLGFGTGALDDVIVKKLTKNIGNTLFRNIATIGLKSAGEGVEEIASLLGEQLVRRMMNMDSKTLKELAEDGTLADTFVQGTLSSLISQAPSGISSTVQGRDYTTGLTRTQQQYVNEIAQQRMVEAQKRNARLNGMQKSQIEDRALTDYQRGRLADANKLQQVNLPGLSTKDMDLQQSAYKYGINPNSEAVVEMKTLFDNRDIVGIFDADRFKGSNENAFWSRNENGKREVVLNPNASPDVLLEEIAIHELTHDLMSSENSQEIIDNQKIMDYVSTLDGYEEARAKVEKLYAKQTKGKTAEAKKAYIDEEIVADTLGKNIGSQEYIRRLIDDEPSIAKNIYDWVVNKVANKNGVKNEKAYWNNVKNNFEKAYNMEYQGKGSDTRHALALNSAMDKHSSEQNARLRKAYDLKKQGYSDDYIWTQTGTRLIGNEDALLYVDDLKFKNNVDITKLPEGTYKASEILDGDLLKNFKEIGNLDVEITNLKDIMSKITNNKSALDSMDSVGGSASLDEGIKLNSKYINDNKNNPKLKQMIEELLSHEVQHIIQDVEYPNSGETLYFGIDKNTDEIFYFGDTQENAQKAYRNHPKEIEAEVTNLQNAMTKEQRHKFPLDLLFDEVKNHYKNNIVDIKTTKFINELEKKYGKDLEKWYTNSRNGVEKDAFKRYTYGNQQNIKDQKALSDSKENAVVDVSYGDGRKTTGYLEDFKRKSKLHDGTSDRTYKELDNSSFSLKEKQLEIILNNNPAQDDYHTWIRSIDDIKTYEEAFQEELDGELQDLTPDFKMADLEKALQTGEMTVYSSYPIEQGIFVTPSKMEAQSYSGSGKVYSKEININDVAWVDTLQGQYAKTDSDDIRFSTSAPTQDNQGRELTKEQQEYFKDSAIKVVEGKYGMPEINENGKLFEVYHGTNNDDFTVFDENYIGSSNDSGWYGKGFYFAFTEGEAKTYGSNVLKAYLNIKKPFDFSGEMQSYDDVTSGDVNFDLGSFIVNLKNKFPEIANKETLRWWEYDSATGEDEARNVTFTELGNKIEDLYNSKDLSIVEINDMGRTKYQYAYGQNLMEYNMPNQVREIIKKTRIFNKSDLNFDLKYPEHSLATDSEREILKEFYEKNDVNFTRDLFGYPTENKELLEKSRLSEATYYVVDKMYRYLDRHMPEYYMQYMGDDIRKELIKQGYDGVIQSKYGDEIVAFYPNQIKRVDNTNPTDDADIRKSQQNEGWQSFLDKNFKPKGTKTRLSDIKLPGLTKAVQEEVQKQTSNALLPIANELKELNKNLNKVLNPTEISQLTPQDANTTPILPGVNRNKVGDGKSKFFDNIKDKTNMLSDETKTAILSSDDVKYYDKVTNKESLDKAYARLQENGQAEVEDWLNKTKQTDGKDARQVTSVDVAEGWILLKQTNDAIEKETDPIRKHQLLQSSVNYAINLRDIGSKAGQVIQAFNILSRLTPEGMVYYAQKELSQAYDQMVQNKTKAWIDENKSKFELQPNEVQFILDTMKDVSTMEDGYDKRFKLAQIQKVLTDKLPPAKGAGMKAWMRISMLFNPKTQVRNVAGNALIAPVNAFGDMFASLADKAIGSKTGVRTTGNFNLKDYTSGMKKGLYESYNDFKHGVNTRNVQGNRFEVTEGKSFNDKNAIGKALNKVDNLLSFVLDAGDRGFYEASFVNSINNQMVLNNTTEVTQDMIDIATQEALSRTWQDNNEYTKFVIGMRNELNRFVHVNGYGLGDILIPFAKTPANLTKAIVDYSPVGLVSTLNKGIKLNRSLTNGQYNAQTQHEFVQSLGKATAGTILYVLGYALAQAGITSGASDEDKDVSNFLKNTLGVNSYSIKIGNKTFTYDWAQPIAAPLSMMANMVQKQKEGATLGENITTTLDTGLNLLFEQSFLESLSNVLSQPGEIGTKMIDQFLDLPSRAVPTLFKQIADLVDGTQRQTYVKDKPVESMINEVKAKIPGLSKTLAPSVDTLGREIQKYGGKNNPFNVFLNPANVNTENISKSGQEIYRLYKETGETNIMPRVAPYYVNKKGEKIVLDTKQRAEYQKVSGSIIENNVAKLLELTEYKNMSDKDKASVVNDIVNYSYNIAQNQVLGTELTKEYERAYEYSKIGDISDYYAFTNSVDDKNADTKRESVFNYLYNSDLEDNQIASLYSKYYSKPQTLDTMLTLQIPMRQFIKFDSADIQGEYNPKTGQTISGSKKNAVIKYVNSLEGLSKAQKAIIIKSTKQYKFDNYNNDIIRYVNNLSGTANDKKVWLKSIGFDNYDRDVVRYIKSQGLSQEETEKKLEDLGFTIRDGRVYY